MGTETLSNTDTPYERAGDTSDNTEVALGELVGRYQLRRVLGEGGMGRVYLARDMTLGRSVALKLVRRDRAGRAAIARFVDEARIIASLNHPHIIQLYDVGEHRGSPYLALEYVEGESLSERSSRERLSMNECFRVMRAIADALGHAHASGVFHCDLKPGNVMLSQDGRLRVVDFGLARNELAHGSGVSGTPDWMAPEQWLGQPPSASVDIWALGVIAASVLAGKHPFGSDASKRREQVLDASAARRPFDHAGVPEQIVDLINRSLERNPSLRPSAAEWLRTIDEVLDGRGALALDEGPYRGLASFTEGHSRFFFGREQEIDAFVERLRSSPVLPVIGPSGAGKSSFLFAGVIPRLHASDEWTVIAFRPGGDPFSLLARRLLSIGAHESGTNARDRDMLANTLRATPTLSAARLATVAAAIGNRVLLVVDQLEELFTHGASDLEVERFLELLMTAADDPLEPVRVVFTLRDDFLGRIGGLRSLFVLRKLEVAELRRTITAPLERLGYRFDDDLVVDEMLSELGDDVAAELPLLQFACRALWDARDTNRGLLLRSAYQHIGGVAGALARHADGVLAELSPSEQRVARQILLAMVVGTTRRQITRDRLVAEVPGAAAVLDRLITARLVVQRTTMGSDVAIVEIAHESLLRTWGQFAEWIDESRDERRLLGELEEATSFWDRRGRRPDEVWTGDELAAARYRLGHLGLAVPSHVEAFLAAGEQRRRTKRRGATIQRTVAGLIGIAITVASLYLAAEFRTQKIAAEHAAGNLGRFDLSLQPYDWVDGARRRVTVESLPKLSWQLYARDPSDVHAPGTRIEQVAIQRLASRGTELLDRIDAPGGPAFIRILGRGAVGESCAPSWVRVQSLPGFAEREGPIRTLDIPVPSCQASRAGTVPIPAGEFVYGGPGEPKTSQTEYVEDERVVTMAEYRIDRTETSNAAFEAFAKMSSITGYPVPNYPTSPGLEHSGDPDMPTTSIDAFEAEAFCRYMGKRLPSDYEWTKAARGGLYMNGEPNPSPKRLYTWVGPWKKGCANIAGISDGADWVAAVDSFPCGASPYGVLNLLGNVSEWISLAGQTARGTPLREIRGGDVESPEDLDHASTMFRNGREARQFTFSIGVRCVEGGTAEQMMWNKH
jgi:serine/threonine protein kinase/formylglycine-generating enzyme required for sulfatase activity